MNAVERLDAASLRLKSWAFHERHRMPGVSEAGRLFFISMQQDAYHNGCRLLTDLVELTPLVLELADSPLAVHDPAAWQAGAEANYQNSCEAAAAFYEPTVTLPAHGQVRLDTHAEFWTPGEPIPHPYLGNQANRCYIQIDALANALLDGAQLKQALR